MVQGIFISSFIVLIIGASCHLASSNAFRKPIVHDGIGGKDTDNLATGCMGIFAAVAFYIVGAILALVGFIVLAFQQLPS